MVSVSDIENSDLILLSAVAQWCASVDDSSSCECSETTPHATSPRTKVAFLDEILVLYRIKASPGDMILYMIILALPVVMHWLQQRFPYLPSSKSSAALQADMSIFLVGSYLPVSARSLFAK